MWIDTCEKIPQEARVFVALKTAFLFEWNSTRYVELKRDDNNVSQWKAQRPENPSASL